MTSEYRIRPELNLGAIVTIRLWNGKPWILLAHSCLSPILMVLFSKIVCFITWCVFFFWGKKHTSVSTGRSMIHLCEGRCSPQRENQSEVSERFCHWGSKIKIAEKRHFVWHFRSWFLSPDLPPSPVWGRHAAVKGFFHFLWDPGNQCGIHEIIPRAVFHFCFSQQNYVTFEQCRHDCPFATQTNITSIDGWTFRGSQMNDSQ